jgi:hypothetical protein
MVDAARVTNRGNHETMKMKTNLTALIAMAMVGGAASALASSYSVGFTTPHGNGTVVAESGTAAPVRFERVVSYVRACTRGADGSTTLVPDTYASGFKADVTVSEGVGRLLVRVDATMARDQGLGAIENGGCRIETPNLSIRASNDVRALPLAGGVIEIPLGDDVVRFAIAPSD